MKIVSDLMALVIVVCFMGFFWYIMVQGFVKVFGGD